MTIKKIISIVFPILSVIVILAISFAVISYGKGYRFDFLKKTIKPTGLLAATSDPTGAQVLIDGELKTATNNTVNITPGWYTITIAKEGYQPWEKRLKIEGEVVTRADAYLFPANPSLASLTTAGVKNPVLSHDGGKLAYVVPTATAATVSSALISRAGVWVLNTGERPLGFSRDAKQIAKSSYLDFSDAMLTWSPDSKQILAAIRNPVSNNPVYYLLETDRDNETPIRIYTVEQLLSEWQTLTELKNQELLSGFKPDLQAMIRTDMKILSFSPDENKILYEASISATLPQVILPPLVGTNTTPEDRDIKPGYIYVYDIKEDKNFVIGNRKELGLDREPTPTPKSKKPAIPPTLEETAIAKLSEYVTPRSLQWLPTNRHLFLISKDKIEAMEYDGANRKTIYAGPFWDGFAVAWSDASRILILTSLNPSAASVPNLYAVNLR